MDSLASRAKEAIMLGYATNQKAYKLWDVSKGEITVSRDVVFDEKRAPPTATKSSVDIGDYRGSSLIGDGYIPSRYVNHADNRNSHLFTC